MISAESLLGVTIGAYTLKAILGQGDRGATFIAQDQKNEQAVVLKFFMPTDTPTQEWLRQVQKEMKTVATLDHPYVAHLIDTGIHNGIPYIVRIYSKETLRSHLQKKGPYELSTANTIIDQVAKAIDFAHAQRKTHRHVRLENILLTQESVLLADFSIEASHTRDVATDLQDLGALLYEIVTGYPVSKPVRSPRELRAEITEEVEKVMLQALEAEYYVQAQDLADDLAKVVMEMYMRRSAAKKAQSAKQKRPNKPMATIEPVEKAATEHTHQPMVETITENTHQPMAETAIHVQEAQGYTEQNNEEKWESITLSSTQFFSFALIILIIILLAALLFWLMSLPK